MNEERVTVGLISDTHGWLNPMFHELFAGVEMILHAGDVGKVSVLEELERIAPTVVVRGNIDGGDLRQLPLEKVVEVGGRRVAMLHIAGSPKRPKKAARELLVRERPDAIVVGHSHIPVVGRVDGTLWINPGAAGRQGFHTECFAALLHVSRVDGTFALDRIHLGLRSALHDLDNPELVKSLPWTEGPAGER